MHPATTLTATFATIILYFASSFLSHYLSTAVEVRIMSCGIHTFALRLLRQKGTRKQQACPFYSVICCYLACCCWHALALSSSNCLYNNLLVFKCRLLPYWRAQRSLLMVTLECWESCILFRPSFLSRIAVYFLCLTFLYTVRKVNIIIAQFVADICCKYLSATNPY